MISNFIAPPIALHASCHVGCKQDVSKSERKRLKAISSERVIMSGWCQVVRDPQRRPVNNVVSVDLIMQRGSI